MRFAVHIALVATAAYMSTETQAVMVQTQEGKITGNLNKAMSSASADVVEKYEDELTTEMKTLLGNIPFMDEVLRGSKLAYQAGQLAAAWAKKQAVSDS